MFCLWWWLSMSGQKVLISVPLGGGIPPQLAPCRCRTGKCWHIRRARREMVQAFSGSRMFGDCSRRSRSPDLGGWCSRLLCRGHLRTDGLLRRFSHFALTSITQTLVILRCCGFPYPQQGTRLNMRYRRVNFNFRLNCGQFFQFVAPLFEN